MDWIRFASIVVRSATGLMINPQSWAQTKRFTCTAPVRRLTSTSATVPTKVPLRVLSPIPRPVAISPEAEFFFGDGRRSQPAFCAAAIKTALALAHPDILDGNRADQRRRRQRFRL